MSPIVGTMYVPQTHTGTHEEIVRGLLKEALEIYCSCMREHAISRELIRIELALGEMGYDFLVGTGPDYGRAWIRKADEPHLPTCVEDERCDCEPLLEEQDPEMRRYARE